MDRAHCQAGPVGIQRSSASRGELGASKGRERIITAGRRTLGGMSRAALTTARASNRSTKNQRLGLTLFMVTKHQASETVSGGLTSSQLPQEKWHVRNRRSKGV